MSANQIRQDRLRRMAERQGWSLRRARPLPHFLNDDDGFLIDDDGWRLIDPCTNAVVFPSHACGASIDDIEEWLWQPAFRTVPRVTKT